VSGATDTVLRAGEHACARTDGGLDVEGAGRPGLGLAGGGEEKRAEREKKNQRTHGRPP